MNPNLSRVGGLLPEVRGKIRIPLGYCLLIAESSLFCGPVCQVEGLSVVTTPGRILCLGDHGPRIPPLAAYGSGLLLGRACRYDRCIDPFLIGGLRLRYPKQNEQGQLYRQTASWSGLMHAAIFGNWVHFAVGRCSCK